MSVRENILLLAQFRVLKLNCKVSLTLKYSSAKVSFVPHKLGMVSKEHRRIAHERCAVSLKGNFDI